MHFLSVCQDGHAKGATESADRLTDPAVADNSQHETVQFDQRFIPVTPIRTMSPPALPDRLCVMPDVLGQFQQQSYCCLGDGPGAISGNIGDENIPFARSGQIDHIGSGSSDAYISQVGQSLKLSTHELNFIGQKDFRPGGARHDVSGRSAVENLTIAKGLQLSPAYITRI